MFKTAQGFPWAMGSVMKYAVWSELYSYKLAEGLQIEKKIYLYLAEKILAVEVNSTNLL